MWIDTTVQDVRFAVRSWTRAPIFAIAAIATLALGIGANTAIVTVASGVLLRPLPYVHPEDLVQVSETLPHTPTSGGWDGGVEYQDLDRWRSHSRLVEGLLSYGRYRKSLQGPSEGAVAAPGEPAMVSAINTERGLFQLLGVAASLGRTFDESDPPNVAVASYDFWKQHFNGDPSAIGRSLTLDGEPFTLIGVMPQGFQFPYTVPSSRGLDRSLATDIWTPWEVPASVRAHPSWRVNPLVARVKSGVTLEAARAELEGMQGPHEGHRLVRVIPLKELVSGPARNSLLVLLGAVGLVLLVACVNVANLLLARTASRGEEIALRAALGASRGRLMRQLLTESLLMALIAGAFGLAIGFWGSRLLLSIASAQIPRAQEIGLDWRVFVFLVAVCLTTGIAFGLPPALIASRGGAHTIKRGGAAATLRHALVVAEIALAFVLLAGAGLLVRTFLNLQRTNPGLTVENVLTGHIVVSGGPESMAIESRVQQIPGVRGAGFISLLPLQNSGWGAMFTINGRTGLFGTELTFVTPGYFQAMEIPLRAGRTFLPQDRAGAPIVTVVNEALAREYFPGENPVGRQTDRGTIIGVVGDVRNDTLRQPAKPAMYHSVAQNFAQINQHGSALVVRADRTPTALVSAIRAAIREINPGQALFRVDTMQGVVEASLAQPRLYAWLIGLFAAMGLLLAMTGIYGVIAYLVALRTREFGIRMALGADAGRVVRLVMRHGVWLTVLGLAVGLGLAALVTRVLQGVLYGVAATDPITFGAMAVLLAIAALAAYFVPARRAARVDPSTALREG